MDSPVFGAHFLFPGDTAVKTKDVTDLSAKIAEMKGTHEHGLLETASDKLTVDFVNKFTSRADSGLLKKHPIVYKVRLKSAPAVK